MIDEHKLDEEFDIPASAVIDYVPETRALSRQDILTAKDVVRERVEVPEWGGHVWAQSLTGAERDQFEASIVENPGTRNRRVRLDNARAKLCALAMVDEEGNRLFDMKDVTALGKKNAAALSRVYNVVARLSGLTDEDMEELLGNSESGPNGDSGID